MDFREAATLVNEIQPKIAVPTHYGSIIGTKQDAEDFIKLLNPVIRGQGFHNIFGSKGQE